MTETIAFVSSRVVDAGSGQRVELDWAAISDTGRRRDVNQDSLIVEFPILAVADSSDFAPDPTPFWSGAAPTTRTRRVWTSGSPGSSIAAPAACC